MTRSLCMLSSEPLFDPEHLSQPKLWSQRQGRSTSSFSAAELSAPDVVDVRAAGHPSAIREGQGSGTSANSQTVLSSLGDVDSPTHGPA